MAASTTICIPLAFTTLSWFSVVFSGLTLVVVIVLAFVALPKVAKGEAIVVAAITGLIGLLGGGGISTLLANEAANEVRTPAKQAATAARETKNAAKEAKTAAQSVSGSTKATAEKAAEKATEKTLENNKGAKPPAK